MNKKAFQIFPVLITSRLILKAITSNDEKEIFEIINCDSTEIKEITPSQLIHELNLGYSEHKTLNWGMYYNDELIGSCGFYRGFEYEIGEIGFVLRKNFRRNGFMREALNKIVAYGYDSLEIDKITAFTKKENEAAKNLLETIGFKKQEIEKGYWKYIHLRKSS